MTAFAENGVIRGAGGIVFSLRDSKTSILLVHRPRFDDWSLPKGKVKIGEQDDEAALREVREETGLQCDLLPPLGEMHYYDRRNRPRLVKYWGMRSRGGVFRPSSEVDQCAWIDLRSAMNFATRSGDREFLARLDSSIQCRWQGDKFTFETSGYFVVYEQG